MTSKYTANDKSEDPSSFIHSKNDTNGYISALQVTENCELQFFGSKCVKAVDTSDVSKELNEINQTLFIENEDKDISPNHAFLSIRIGYCDSENKGTGLSPKNSSSGLEAPTTFALLCNQKQELKFATCLDDNLYKYADFRTNHYAKETISDNISNKFYTYRLYNDFEMIIDKLKQLLPKKWRECSNLSHSEAQILLTFLVKKDELIPNLLSQTPVDSKIKYFIITVHSRYDPCHGCQEFLKLLRIYFLRALLSNQEKYKYKLYSIKPEKRWMIPIIVISNNYRRYYYNELFVDNEKISFHQNSSDAKYKSFPGTILVDPPKNGIFYLLSFIQDAPWQTLDKTSKEDISLSWPFYLNRKFTVKNNGKQFNLQEIAKNKDYSFYSLGKSTNQIYEDILSNNDENIRKEVVDDFLKAIKVNDLPFIENFDNIRKIQNKLDLTSYKISLSKNRLEVEELENQQLNLNNELNNLAQNEDNYKAFLKHYLLNGGWLSYDKARYGILSAAALLLERSIFIWSDDENEEKPVHQKTCNNQDTEIHLLQRAGFTHFSLLVTENSTASKSKNLTKVTSSFKDLRL